MVWDYFARWKWNGDGPLNHFGYLKSADEVSEKCQKNIIRIIYYIAEQFRDRK